MQFVLLGKPLTIAMPGYVSIPLQEPLSDGTPTLFTPGDGNDGGAVIGFVDWEEAKGQACLEAGVEFMNFTAQDKVEPDLAASLVLRLFPSAAIGHEKEFRAALDAYAKVKPGGVNILEWMGVANELLPVVGVSVPQVDVPDGIKAVADKLGFGMFFK